jgi:hypothetical protein
MTDMNDILDMWQKDSEIDKTELGDEAARCSNLHAKYLRLFYNERMKLIKAKKKISKFKKIMFEYWNGTLDEDTQRKYNLRPQPLRILKSDIPMYMDSDPILSQLSEEINSQELVIEALESILKHISNRGFQIKNIIDWVKFNHGI